VSPESSQEGSEIPRTRCISEGVAMGWRTESNPPCSDLPKLCQRVAWVEGVTLHLTV
jgi:hypothetical protein